MRRLFPLLFAFLLCVFQGAFAGGQIDVNTADSGQLQALPGIGPSKAAAILQYRSQHGAFKAVSELDNVPGIGPATMANLTPLVTVGDGATVTASDPATTAPAGPSVNINTASPSQLQQLPGIGPAKAAAITSYREKVGPFKTCDQLDAVDGIGKATIATLKPQCTTE